MAEQILGVMSTKGIVQFFDIIDSIYPEGFDRAQLLEVGKVVDNLVSEKIVMPITLKTGHGEVFRGYELTVLYRLAAL